MKIDFNGKSYKGESDGKMTEGSFEDLQKMRKKNLSKFEATIQKALENYNGETMCLIIVSEDENGLPTGHHVMRAGVSRLECQVDLAFALDRASDDTMEDITKAVGNDPRAMLQVATEVLKRKMQKED